MPKTIRSASRRKTPTPARPLYEVFLERVINIPAVQCHREAASSDQSTSPERPPALPTTIARHLAKEGGILRPFARPIRVVHFKPGALPRVYPSPRRPVDFFSDGYTCGRFGEFMWSLGELMEEFPWTWQDINASLPLLRAGTAAVAAFKKFIKEIADRKWIASGVHPATGVRHDLDPAAEFTCTNRILDVRGGSATTSGA